MNNQTKIQEHCDRIKELSVFKSETEKEILKLCEKIGLTIDRTFNMTIGNLNVDKAGKAIDILNDEIEPILDKLINQYDRPFDSYDESLVTQLIELLDNRSDFNNMFRLMYVSYVSLHRAVCEQNTETLQYNSKFTKALKILETIEIFDKLETENKND